MAAVGNMHLVVRPSGIWIVFLQHVSNQPPNQSTWCHGKEDTFSTHRRGDPMSHIHLLTAGCVCVCVCVVCQYWWHAVISFVIKLFCASIFPLPFPGIEQGCAGRKRMSSAAGCRRLSVSVFRGKRIMNFKSFSFVLRSDIVKIYKS
jgi:hypothetical protein